MTKTWQTVVVFAAVLGVSGVVAAQGPQLSRVMREKLQHTQKILETVVTSDWSGLESHTRDLERLTNDPRWMVLKSQEYAKHSAEFVGALHDLRRVAGERDSKRATEAYTALIIRCVDCHQYVARARIAR